MFASGVGLCDGGLQVGGRVQYNGASDKEGSKEFVARLGECTIRAALGVGESLGDESPSSGV